MKACINYDYERDYILEAMLMDKTRQENKNVQKKFDFRKTTKTSEARIKLGREKMKNQKESSVVSKSHKPGSVPQYYPMVKVNKMLNKEQGDVDQKV